MVFPGNNSSSTVFAISRDELKFMITVSPFAAKAVDIAFPTLTLGAEEPVITHVCRPLRPGSLFYLSLTFGNRSLDSAPNPSQMAVNRHWLSGLLDHASSPLRGSPLPLLHHYRSFYAAYPQKALAYP